jgi:N-acetyl-anhydromuramyl-L-alanine amidase AmpD
MSASAHVFVDDKEAIICIPCLEKPEKAWHVQYNKVRDNALYGDDANDVAIGLELCYFPQDQQRSLKAYQNYVEVAAYLAKYHNVDPSKRSGHFELDPERRTDPNNALKYIGKTYENMKDDIISTYKILVEKESTIPEENQQVSAWAKEAREWVMTNNISDGTNPKKETTREELWTMLHRFYQLIKS